MHATQPADAGQQSRGRAVLVWAASLALVVVAVTTAVFTTIGSLNSSPQLDPPGPATDAVVVMGDTDRLTAERIVADTATHPEVAATFAELHAETSLQVEGNLYEPITVAGVGDNELHDRRVVSGRLPAVADEIAVSATTSWELGEQVNLSTHDYGLVPVTVVGIVDSDPTLDAYAHPAMLGAWFSYDLSGRIFVAGAHGGPEVVDALSFLTSSATLPIEQITTAAEFSAGRMSPVPADTQWLIIITHVLAVLAIAAAVGRMLPQLAWWWIILVFTLAGTLGGVAGAAFSGAWWDAGTPALAGLSTLIVVTARLGHQRRLNRRVAARPGLPTNADLLQISVGLALMSASLFSLTAYATAAADALRWFSIAAMSGVLIALAVRFLPGRKPAWFGAPIRSLAATGTLAIALTAIAGGVSAWQEPVDRAGEVRVRTVEGSVTPDLLGYVDSVPQVSATDAPRVADVAGPLGTVESVYLAGEPGSEVITLGTESVLRSELVDGSVTELTTSAGPITVTVDYGTQLHSLLDPAMLPPDVGIPGNVIAIEASAPTAVLEALAHSPVPVVASVSDPVEADPAARFERGAMVGGWLVALLAGVMWWAARPWTPERRNRYFTPADPADEGEETWRPED